MLDEAFELNKLGEGTGNDMNLVGNPTSYT